jgi:quercetin dioxygenase-like cupin family protein
MSDLVIVRGADLPRFPLVEGIDITPLAGERLNINVAFLTPNSVAPVHRHVEEQMGYIVRGWCLFSDGSTETRLEPGDLYHALPDVPHGATAGPEGCVIIDVFSPPKAEVLKLLGRA